MSVDRLSQYRFHLGVMGNNIENAERGRMNSQRAFRLMQDMVEDGKISSVRRGSKRQINVRGIDFIVGVSLQAIEGTYRIDVPIQVTSSAQGARYFREQSERLSRPNPLTIVVNPYQEDNFIKGEIERKCMVFAQRKVFDIRRRS